MKVESAKDDVVVQTIKQKYCLLYACDLIYGGRKVSLTSMSLPFVVSVHGTQDWILGSIFWDSAFSNFIVRLQSSEDIT